MVTVTVEEVAVSPTLATDAAMDAAPPVVHVPKLKETVTSGPATDTVTRAASFSRFASEELLIEASTVAEDP
jgi:hypothetical protein